VSRRRCPKVDALMVFSTSRLGDRHLLSSSRSPTSGNSRTRSRERFPMMYSATEVHRFGRAPRVPRQVFGEVCSASGDDRIELVLFLIPPA